MERELISFVIPCYNSTDTIAAVVKEIRETMTARLMDYDYEVILVNDGSPDRTTFDAIKKEMAQDTHIKGIDLARNFGQPCAVMAGLNKAKGDYIVCGDDDGQTPFEELPKLLEKIKEGYDVVEARYAVREKRTWFRRLGTMMNEGMATWLINKPRGIVLTTYWMVRRFVADEMTAYSSPYPYLGGLMMRTTQNVCNVDVTHRERISGKSGYSLKKMIQLWLNGFTSFSVKPLRIIAACGIFVAIGGFIYGGYVIVNRILHPNLPAGYSSLMAVMLLMFGTLFFFMGLMGEYVGRIYISLNKAPQFVIKQYLESLESQEEPYERKNTDEE